MFPNTWVECNEKAVILEKLGSKKDSLHRTTYIAENKNTSTRLKQTKWFKTQHRRYLLDEHALSQSKLIIIEPYFRKTELIIGHSKKDLRLCAGFLTRTYCSELGNVVPKYIINFISIRVIKYILWQSISTIDVEHLIQEDAVREGLLYSQYLFKFLPIKFI